MEIDLGESEFAIIANDGREFRTDKSVLVAESDYFAKLLEIHMVESKNKRVSFVQFDSNLISSMLHFMHHGEFEAGVELCDLLDCAVYLLIPKAVRAASNKILQQELNIDNWFTVLSLFQTYSLSAPIAETKSFVRAEFSKVLVLFISKLLGQYDFGEAHGKLSVRQTLERLGSEEVHFTTSPEDLAIVETLIELWELPEIDLFFFLSCFDVEEHLSECSQG